MCNINVTISIKAFRPAYFIFTSSAAKRSVSWAFYVFSSSTALATFPSPTLTNTSIFPHCCKELPVLRAFEEALLFRDVITAFANFKYLCVLCVICEVNLMPNITLSVPEDMKQKMDESKFINWSEVAREAIRERLAELALFKSIVAKSTLTEKDAIEIGNKISKSMHEKYKKKYSGLK